MQDFCNFDPLIVDKYIDPTTIEPILASHLIPLGKGNSENRPIHVRVGKVIRMIVKCVTKVTKQYILESSDFLQVCTEHKSGSEASVHALNSLFQHEEADAVPSIQ